MEKEGSRYRVGDYVVYGYEGSYRGEPVRITEEIIAKDGDRLVIMVEWESGKGKRAWKQFVTDTPHNRDNNVVDRLVLLEGGQEKDLPNRNNEDAYSLYEGTYICPQEKPVLLKEERKKLDIAGKIFLCEIKTYRTKVLDKNAEMISVESGEFLWTHVGGSYIAEDGEVLYRMVVLEFGNRG